MYRYALIALILFSCSQLQKENKPTEVKDTIPASETVVSADTLMPEPTEPDTLSDEELYPIDLTGTHGLTIQWIGWDKPGKASIVKDKEEDGWFVIKGSQRHKDNFLTVEGKIRPLSKSELMFRGDILYRVDNINNGDTCKKSGEQLFLSTQNRKYWRMQDMASCEGGTIDYIDIYF